MQTLLAPPKMRRKKQAALQLELNSRFGMGCIILPEPSKVYRMHTRVRPFRSPLPLFISRSGIIAINPSQDVVLFDGQCNFCRRQIDNLRRFDGKDRLRFLSLHDPSVADLYPDLSFAQLMDQMWVVSPSGEKFGGADAFRYLSKRLPLLWPIMPLLHLPFCMPLWRYLYKQIAKRRYKIAGRNCDEGGTCTLHQ